MPWFHFHFQDFCVAFLSILFEGVPFMLIGTLISGVIDAFLPPEAMSKLLPRRSILAVALSGLLGIVFPMCECGVVPVIRRMIHKGLPVSCALTYLLAAPIVNPIVAVSTLAAFQGQSPVRIALLRIGLGYAVAVFCGLLVQALPVSKVLNRAMLAPKPNRRLALVSQLRTPPPTENGPGMADDFCAPKSFGSKMAHALRCASHDFLDVAFYLVIGAALASVFNTAVSRDLIAPLADQSLLATASMMGLAMLLSLCSTSDAFIAANFLGFPLAAKLAFMVLGPMMDIKLLFMYGLVFRKRFTLLLALLLFALVGAVCLAVG